MTSYSKDFILRKTTKQDIPLSKIEKEALDYKHLLFNEESENTEKINEERPKTGKGSWKNNENNKKTYPNQNLNKGTPATKTPTLNWKSKKFTANEPEKEKEPEIEIEKEKEKIKEEEEYINMTNKSRTYKPEKKTNGMKKKEKKESLHAELEETLNQMIDGNYKGNPENDLEYTVHSIVNNAINDDEYEYYGVDSDKKKKKKRNKNRKSSALSEKSGKESLKPLDPGMVFDPSLLQNSQISQENINPQMYPNWNNGSKLLNNNKMYEDFIKDQNNLNATNMPSEQGNNLDPKMNLINPTIPSLMPPFRPHPMFMGGNMNMVFPPQPFPGAQNIFPPNIIIEPLDIDNIFLFNKKFNIPNDKSIWYIYNQIQSMTSLPISSTQLFELYNMKMITGEVDIRPIDIFQFAEQMPFSFVKLKVINDINWVERITDSALLKFTELFVLSTKLKANFSEKHNRKSSNVSNKNKSFNKEYNNLAENVNENFNRNEKYEEEVFEVVGKKRKNKNENFNKNNQNQITNKPQNNKEIVNYVNPNNQKNSGKNNSKNNQPIISQNNKPKQNKQQQKQNIEDDSLYFNESTINASNLEEQKDLIKNLENSEKNKKSGLQNILNEVGEEDWELVNKKKKKQKELEKELEKEKEKGKKNQIKSNEAAEQMKLKEKKEEQKPDETINIVEKLKVNNPYYNNKDNVKRDPLEDLMNSKKFEVVVKKKKKKNDGKKPPGMN